MQTIDDVLTMDTFPTTESGDAQISEVWNSHGGYATINNADVYVKLQYGSLGESYWTEEFHVQQGGMTLLPGTIGIALRSYTPGLPATISAAIAGPKEPEIILSGSPNSGPTVVLSGQTAGTNGTPTPIHPSSYPCIAVAVKADPANSGKVYLGDSTVTTLTGLELAADDGVAFDIGNLEVVFFDVDKTGEGISWLVISN